jgi:hypothetical protein
MYMLPYRCNVTGATSTTPVATAKPPVLCDTDPSKCVSGAKQMFFWHQLEGNNIPDDVTPSEYYARPSRSFQHLLNLFPPLTAYDMNMGFADGSSPVS